MPIAPFVLRLLQPPYPLLIFAPLTHYPVHYSFVNSRRPRWTFRTRLGLSYCYRPAYPACFGTLSLVGMLLAFVPPDLLEQLFARSACLIRSVKSVLTFFHISVHLVALCPSSVCFLLSFLSSFFYLLALLL